jgi:general secretion pathway protein N
MRVLALLALLLAATVAWLATGVGSQPQWPPPLPAAAPTQPGDTPQPAPPPSLQALAGAWQTPLFSPDRAPDKAVQATQPSPDLNGLRLTGVVIDGAVRRALFKQADGHDLSLREGAQLANGWHLQRVEAQAVQLELNGQQRRLLLPSPRLPNMPMTPAASSILLDRPAHSPPAPGGH